MVALHVVFPLKFQTVLVLPEAINVKRETILLDIFITIAV